MLPLVLALSLSNAAPGASAKWLRMLQPRPVKRADGDAELPRPTKAQLIQMSADRVEKVPEHLGEMAEIHGQATADRELALPGKVVDALHGAFLGGRNRLTTLAARQYAWSAALHGQGPLDHQARVRMDTSAGPRVVKVHLTGDRDEPEISVEVESTSQALEEDHLGAVGGRFDGTASSANYDLHQDYSDRFKRPERFFQTDGPRPDRTASGRVREDGTFDVDRVLGRSLQSDASFEDRLHVAGRIRDDGMVELWALDRKYVLNGVPLTSYQASAHGVAPFAQSTTAVPPRAPVDARSVVGALAGPMPPNRWSRDRGGLAAAEVIHQLNHTDFLHGATDYQLVAPAEHYIHVTAAGALFGSWTSPKGIRSRWDSDKMSVLTVAPLARAMEILHDRWKEAVPWARRFLTGSPVRADLVTPDTVPYLARMALAAEIPFDDVRVQYAGAVIPLTHHPSFPREARDLAAEEQFMNERLVALERLGDRPATPETATASEAEVRSLLFDGPRFHFGDLVSQLVFYRELWGARLPAEASATPHAFEDAARGEAFVRELAHELRHPGAAAVLAGLLTRVPQEALQRALAETTPRDAAVWARIGAGLQRFPARLVPYVLSDVLVDPEHRHLDSAVLDLRVRALQALMDLQAGRLSGDPLEALDQEAHAALGKRGTAILARALVDYAPFFTREGSLARVALVGFFQERMRGIAETEDQAGSFFAPEFAREAGRLP